MTENEIELINLIQKSKDPEQALFKAADIIQDLYVHETKDNGQSPYLEEIAELLPQLSSNKQSKALNYLIELKGE